MKESHSGAPHALTFSRSDAPRLPGQELVDQGLADLAQDLITDCALLVLIAAPRLRRLGIDVPERAFPEPCEHLLYDRLDERLGLGDHSHYNSLIRRIVSYARALEREQSRKEGRLSVTARTVGGSPSPPLRGRGPG